MIAPAEVVVSSRPEPFTAHFNPRETLHDLLAYRHLIGSLAWRETQSRFRGSWLGIAWMVLQPLLMLGVYSFVFAVVFRARWGGAKDSSPSEYSLALFCGLVVFSLVAQCVGAAPSLLPRHADYVKSVVFPLQILPVVLVATELLASSFSLGILLIGVLVLHGWISPLALLLPVILIPAVLLALAAGWILSALGAFFHDLEQVTALLVSVLLFITPIFFPLTAVSRPFRVVLQINPLTSIVEAARGLLLWGRPPDWALLLGVTAASALAAQFGYALFMRLRQGFADVM